MKATVRDKSTLSALRPLEVAGYSPSQGWKQVAEKANQSSVWTLTVDDDEELEITLPLTDSIGDFALRMSDVLSTLFAVEEGSQLEIIRDLINSSADVIRVRLVDVELSDGQLPLDNGAQLVQQAREALLAAACSAVNPRSHFPARKPQQAVDYLRGVRLGQTEVDGFVLTLLSPV